MMTDLQYRILASIDKIVADHESIEAALNRLVDAHKQKLDSIDITTAMTLLRGLHDYGMLAKHLVLYINEPSEEAEVIAYLRQHSKALARIIGGAECR